MIYWIVVPRLYSIDCDEEFAHYSPAPTVVRDRSVVQPLTSSAPPTELHIDESKPVTTLQIRLSDGTRYVIYYQLKSVLHISAIF